MIRAIRRQRGTAGRQNTLLLHAHGRHPAGRAARLGPLGSGVRFAYGRNRKAARRRVAGLQFNVSDRVGDPGFQRAGWHVIKETGSKPSRRKTSVDLERRFPAGSLPAHAERRAEIFL